MLEKKETVHFRDGRDSNVETNPLDAGRVGVVWLQCAPFVATRIIGIADWKGNLSVVWAGAPSVADQNIAKAAWNWHCEEQIDHIYRDTFLYKALDAGEDTLKTDDIEGILVRLGMQPLVQRIAYVNRIGTK